MANFEDIAKKAFFVGVGFASYAQEKANDTLQDLRVQAQKLAEEMAERGEMNTEQARKFVDELIEQAQQGKVPNSNPKEQKQPRRITIVDEGEKSDPTPEAKTESSASDQDNDSKEDLRQQVQALQEELSRLKQEM